MKSMCNLIPDSFLIQEEKKNRHSPILWRGKIQKPACGTLPKFSHRGDNPLRYSKICLREVRKGYGEAVLGDLRAPFSKVLAIGSVLGSTSGQTVRWHLLV